MSEADQQAYQVLKTLNEMSTYLASVCSGLHARGYTHAALEADIAFAHIHLALFDLANDPRIQAAAQEALKYDA